MTLPESLLVALFCISMVFAVLLCLCVLIKLFSTALGVISDNSGKSGPPSGQSRPSPETEGASPSGALKTRDGDAPEARLIKAVVSDEAGIPLCELCFKSIKLIR